MRKVFWILALSLFLSISYSNAQITLGCCSNPGAGTLACTDERLTFSAECCPRPESNFTSYYKSTQNPIGPSNYAECTSNFFFTGRACTSVDSCAIGCCCSDAGGTIKPEAQCKGASQVFYKGTASCSSACPTPQCNDGIDNDNNGCIDFTGSDTGCQNPSDATESGGKCVPAGANCNNPSYTPKLTGFDITPLKGQKAFSLQWIDECAVNSVYYEISRCDGVGCANFNLISNVNTNLFIDSSQDIEFGKFYTYKLKAYYSLQSATPTLVRAGTLGDSECLDKKSSNNFCFNNSAYYCNQLNKMVAEGTRCQSGKICVISGNKPSCFNQSICGTKDFGLYSTLSSCEAKGYCFYDRSHSTVDYCFGCNPAMSCYDYKTSQACSRDHCGIGSCEWKSISSQPSIGACINKEKYNCEWCSSSGTPELENSRSYNQIFDVCNIQKSRALSTNNYKCYFSNGISKSCENVVCSDYSQDQCSAAQISHDELNNIVNPSNDECGIKSCQKIGNACAKNADGDNAEDCTNEACEQDYFAPNATLIPINRKGILDSIAIQIYDKRNSNGSYVLQTAQNYATFMCLEPCGSAGHPYQNSTQARSLIVSNLNVYDGRSGAKLFTFADGQNTIRYYPQDPSKNIGTVKKLTFDVHGNSAGPKVLSFNITSGAKTNEKFYTNSLQPTISIEFFEPAVITYARITNKNTGAIISLETGTGISKTFNLSLEGSLPEGEYLFEMNAKNGKNIFIDPQFSSIFVIDSTPPTITITPANGEVANSLPAAIRLQFSEEVQIKKIKINSEDFMNLFTTVNNKIFTASVNFTDGSKIMEISANDFAQNRLEKTSTFIIDSTPTQINLVKPKFGVSSNYTFDVLIDTDNNAECRYGLDDNLEYEFMERFTLTTGTRHTIKSLSINKNNKEIHRLFVKCKDNVYGITSKSFDLSVDDSAPQITNAFAFPSPIVESPITTTLTVESNEPVLCKYSATKSDFESMESKFVGFANYTFMAINRQPITLAGQGEYSYYTACMNRAELVSATSAINFTANLTSIISIKSNTPRFFNSSNAVLAIQTDKKSQCKYSETDSTAQTGQIFGNPEYAHTKQLSLAAGDHHFYVICKDQYREEWSPVFVVDAYVDTTGPTMAFVDDTGTIISMPEKTCNTDRLRVKFLGEDMESGVKQYSYSILKDGQTITRPQYTFAGNEWIWVENLSLQNEANYIFSVKAKNHAELEGASKESDGITVSTSLCDTVSRCGDSLINKAGEECDRNTFGMISSCLNYTNFIGGTLMCSDSCKLDTSSCQRIPECGNNEIDPGETCDGNSFGKITGCTDYSNSFSGGTLKCSSTCQLDTSSCTEKPKCGNAVIESGESCDGTNLGPLTGKCSEYSSSIFTDGDITCNACKLDTSKCQGVQGTCGNGIVNLGESCDGNSFGIITGCTDYSNFNGGTLKCSPTCQLDTSSCTEKPKCGNTAIDLGETCDTNNIGPISGKCLEYSADFTGGNMQCIGCKLDSSACEKPSSCGNSRLDSGEFCDGSLFRMTNISCSSYSSTFQKGALTCSSCKISTNNCDSNVTDAIPISCKDRGTCEANEICSDNSECRSRYCVDGRCKPASCGDSAKNQGESDTDCGGPCELKCSDDRNCNTDGDCSSNYCNFGACSQLPQCKDGTLSPGEADTDCGGACPSKCGIGQSCQNDDDCETESKCTSSQCASAGSGSKDSDGDGMPDDWELANGLDPKDPSDAGLDFDNDGLTNKEEFDVQNLYSRSTDPTEIDTDGDGYSDKEELDKNTDPTDPESFPKSGKLKIILFIIGAVILISGFGYLGYIAIQKNRKKEFEAYIPRQAPKQTITQGERPQPARTFTPSTPPNQFAQQRQPIPQRPISGPAPLRERILQKDLERKKLFESFGEQRQGKPEEKKPEAGQAKILKEKKTEKKKTKRQPRPIKPKEDVFEKLKSIAREKKKSRK